MTCQGLSRSLSLARAEEYRSMTSTCIRTVSNDCNNAYPWQTSFSSRHDSLHYLSIQFLQAIIEHSWHRRPTMKKKLALDFFSESPCKPTAMLFEYWSSAVGFRRQDHPVVWLPQKLQRPQKQQDWEIAHGSPSLEFSAFAHRFVVSADEPAGYVGLVTCKTIAEPGDLYNYA